MIFLTRSGFLRFIYFFLLFLCFGGCFAKTGQHQIDYQLLSSLARQQAAAQLPDLTHLATAALAQSELAGYECDYIYSINCQIVFEVTPTAPLWWRSFALLQFRTRHVDDHSTRGIEFLVRIQRPDPPAAAEPDAPAAASSPPPPPSTEAPNEHTSALPTEPAEPAEPVPVVAYVGGIDGVITVDKYRWLDDYAIPPHGGAPITETALLQKLQEVFAPFIPKQEPVKQFRAFFTPIVYNYTQAPHPQVQFGRTRDNMDVIVVTSRESKWSPVPFANSYDCEVELQSGQVLSIGVLQSNQSSSWSVVNVFVRRDAEVEQMPQTEQLLRNGQVLQNGQVLHDNNDEVLQNEKLHNEQLQHNNIDNSNIDDNTEVSSLRMMSVNVWNYSPPWTRRAQLLAEEIIAVNADVVAVQELRNDWRRENEGVHQITQLAKLLPHLPYFALAPAHYEVDLALSAAAVLHEGVGILSRYPLYNVTYIPLSRITSDRSDAHNRTCLHAAVQLPLRSSQHSASTEPDGLGEHQQDEHHDKHQPVQHQPVQRQPEQHHAVQHKRPKQQHRYIHVFGTHMSLSPDARMRNMGEMLNFFDSYRENADRDVHVFVGDLNTTPNATEIWRVIDEGFTDVWSGKEKDFTGSAVFIPPDTNDFGMQMSAATTTTTTPHHAPVDMFPYPCRQDGMTFPMDNPRKRIDFMFYRPVNVQRTSVRSENACVLERGQVGDAWPSDHNLLVVDLKFQATK